MNVLKLPPTLSGPLVLVVEDDEATREAFALILRGAGFRVETAGNGREGLKQLHRERPCCVLLDLMMPVMDGWQFRAAQWADPALAAVPVVVCTAAGACARTAELRAEAYLRKPVDPALLLEAVRRWCA
jgi:CheY-like chemotaxis protein